MDIKRLIKRNKKIVLRHKWLSFFIFILVITSFVIKLDIALERPLYPKGTDPHSYHQTAIEVSSGKGYIGNYFNPGETIFLTGVYSIFGPSYKIARVIHIIVSFVLAFFIYKIGALLFGRQIGFIAGAVSLFDPFVIFYSTTLFGEMIMVTAVTIAIYYSMKYVREEANWKNAVIIGVFTGISMLFKVWLVVVIPLFAIYRFIYMKKTKNWPLLFKELAVIVVAVLIIIVPWLIYSKHHTGHYAINTASGKMFFFGNNPYATVGYGYYPPEMGKLIYWDNTTDNYLISKRGRDYAINYIIENPGKTAKKTWQFFYKYWSHPNTEFYQRPLPKQDLQMTYLWIKWILLAIGSIYVLLKALKGNLMLLLFSFITFWVYALTFYLARYKFTVIFIDLIYMAAGIVILIEIVHALLKQSSKG